VKTLQSDIVFLVLEMEFAKSQINSMRSTSLAVVDASKERATVVYDFSKAKAMAALQPFQPYYVKVCDGVATVVAKIGDRVVIIQTKVSNVASNVRVRMVDSLAHAQAIIEPYTSPLLSGAMNLKSQIGSRVQHFVVSINNGVVYIRGAVGARILSFQAKLSDMGGFFYTKFQGFKTALSELTRSVVGFVSYSFGETINRVQILSAKVKDGFVFVACKANDTIIVLKIKVMDVKEVIQAKSLLMYNSSLEVLTETYGGTKTRLARAAVATKSKAFEAKSKAIEAGKRATEVTKAKAIESGAAARSLAANPKAQVTAASAAGGAVGAAVGAPVGTVAGGTIGAALAVPAVFFTFGLSIPVGVAVGAGTGLCIGTAAGGATGLVTGGAAGYGIQKHKDDIGSRLDGALSRAKEAKDFAKARAMRVIGHTGGTAEA
jgi:hypothetical protein